MIDFIIAYWDSILVCLALVALVVFLLVRGKKDIVYKILYSLVNEAEKLFGAGTGKLKFAYVMERAYTMLPAIIKLFITYPTFEKWIEKAVDKMKEDLAEKANKEEQAEIAE